MNHSSLSEEQQNTLAQFRSISNTNISDSDIIVFLGRNNWDLELSLIDYYQVYPSRQTFLNHYTERINNSSMNGNSNRPNTPNIFNRIWNFAGYQALSDSENGGTSNMPGAFISEQTVHPSKLYKLINNSAYYVMFILILPLVFLFAIFKALIYFVVNKLFPVVSKLVGLDNNSSSRTYYARKNLTNPTERSRRFIYEFDEFINNKPLVDIQQQLPPPTEYIAVNDSSLMEIQRPNFLECSYTNALYKVKKECSWLMIYLQSDHHEDKATFINEILLNKQFLKFLQEKQIYIWGGNLKESESFQIADTFSVNKFPFLGLLTLTVDQIPTSTGSNTSSPTLSLVSKIQGVPYKYFNPQNMTLNINKVINKFNRTYERQNPTLVSLRTEHEQRERERNLRLEQDLAYQRSLENDRRREQERLRLIQQHEEEERRSREAEEKAARNQEQKLKWLYWRYQNLRPEPDMKKDDKKSFARVAIRLNNEKRISRLFYKDCKIEEIFAFVECITNDIPNSINSEDSFIKPKDYNHIYKFRLMSMLPKEELKLSYDEEICNNKLVYPNGNLIMIEPEDDE
ncbi:hypothetical protein PACTADRAFT_376 [Pachysolen tannophilus NRRL Y-2460]|uniref:UBX domain-containing protein n=1 Tax=Pachysolen tannophilus NRRL Y-2460 TaxID=669874 RepID=A0A1E4U1M1_PACTA|nr:hypothetical protein PACTADRAFT_376 [Pachysolen tannophilus NRRL Y-2460]